MTLFTVTIFAFVIGFCRGDQAIPDENGDHIFQEYMRWNYTFKNPSCSSPAGQNPCQDIRTCHLAGPSLSMGGWPTLCGWVGTKVPKVCCGLPLVLGPTLMKKVDREISRKRECGRTTYDESLSRTLSKFFEVVKSRPKVEITDPNKFDPPLDLNFASTASSLWATTSKQGEFPWMVSVQKNGRHACDGTLISRKHILTAAHCLLDEFGKYSILVGNMLVDDGYPIDVTKIRIHPEFNKEKMLNNLGLLTLDQEILTPSVPHICLAGDESLTSGASGTLLQWQTVNSGGAKRLKMCMSEPLKIVPLENCFTNAEDGVRNPLIRDFLCTEKSRNAGKCGKSAGGPLMHKNIFSSAGSPRSEASWSIIGINTLDSDDSGSPYAAFTRIDGFTNWIQTAMREDSSPNNVRYE